MIGMTDKYHEKYLKFVESITELPLFPTQYRKAVIFTKAGVKTLQKQKIMVARAIFLWEIQKRNEVEEND